MITKEAYYFPHDSNAIQDPKLMTLLSECGLAGIGAFWIIIEILHQQESGRITTLEYEKYLKFYTHFENPASVEQVLNKCKQVLIASGLLVEQDGFISSTRVLKNKHARLVLAKKRSSAGSKSAKARLGLAQKRSPIRPKPTENRAELPENSGNSTSVEQVLNKCSTNNEQVLSRGQQGKERKGKEIKGKEKKRYIDCIYLSDDEYKKIVELFGDSGAQQRIKNLNDGIMSKGYKYKSHYHTILNWERRSRGQFRDGKPTHVGETEGTKGKYADQIDEVVYTDA